MYMTFSQKSAYVCDFYPKTHVYREGSGKKQAKAKPIKGSVNGQTYHKMRHRNREKQRASQEYQAHCARKTQIKIRNIPSGVAISITERNSYGLGYHNRQLDSRNQSFPIFNRNKMSNTKRSNLVPYSGWLK